MTESISKYQRNHAIDFLKIAASIFIVFHHYTQTVYVSGKGVFFGGPFNFGSCVEFFFIVSGYMMCRYQAAIQKHEITFKHFYGRRALRLLPLVAISAIAYELLIILYREVTGTLYAGHNLDLSGTLFDCLGIQAGWAVSNPTINNPTWFISVLLLCYLIFYVLNFLTGKKKLNVYYFYIIVVLVGMGSYSFKLDLPFFNTYSGRGYFSFFTGILLANFLSQNRNRINKFSIVGLVLIVGTVLTVMYKARNGKNFDQSYWLTFAFYPSLIILAETNAAKKLFSSHIWSAGAIVAYNVFIWHVNLEIIYKGLLMTIPYLAEQAEWKMMLFALVIDWIVGIVSYICIEKPLEKRSKSFYDKYLK